MLKNGGFHLEVQISDSFLNIGKAGNSGISFVGRQHLGGLNAAGPLDTVYASQRPVAPASPVSLFLSRFIIVLAHVFL